MEGGCWMEKKRRSIFVCILLLCAWLSIVFHNIAQASPAAVLTESTFNFGSVVEGTKIKHDFVLKNEGTEQLVIEKIRTG